MGLIACPHCFKDIYDGVETCPHCGGPISSETIAQGEKRLKEGFHAYILQKEKRWFIASAVFGLLAAMLVLSFFTAPEFSGFLDKLGLILYALIVFPTIGSWVYSVFCMHLYFGMKSKSIIGWTFLFSLALILVAVTCFIPSTILFVRSIYKKAKKQPVFSEEFVIDRCG